MLSVLDALFRPIARLSIARGLVFSQVADRLKVQFLNASSDLSDGGKLTDSRVSVMTGLQRRDIARLRDLPKVPEPGISHLARLVLAWRTIFGHNPVSRDDFNDLALSIRKDVHPRSMLEQLVYAGTVEDKDGSLHLLTQTYQPLAGSMDQLDYLARNASDFLTAATENVMKDPAPHFEQAAHFNLLSEDAIAQLRQQYTDAQMRILEDLAKAAQDLQVSSPGSHRFRAGGYFYHKDDQDA